MCSVCVAVSPRAGYPDKKGVQQRPKTFSRLHFLSLTYRTANLQSCILYIYSTNIDTEYFKHGIYSPFLSLFKMQFVS